MILCRGYGIKLGVETCGYWKLNQTIWELFEGLDFIYYDIKCVSEDLHQKYTGVSNQRILDNLKILSKQYSDKIIATIPLIPGFNDNIEEF